jgi:NADPH:quinone reductase-like Zn-dependent oxidoreductase
LTLRIQPMKKIIIKKHDSNFGEALQLVENQPDLVAEKEGDVIVEVEAFGINYADILACKGMYPDAPPLPCTIGYEVVGRVKEVISLKVKSSVADDLKVGDRVAAFCMFGGYATQTLSNVNFCVKIDDAMECGVALALMVQYCTAWYSACHATCIAPGDNVLIHAAAGGVGTALAQIAKHRGATVFGTASASEKLKYLKEELAVDVPINYKTDDFTAVVKESTGGIGLDVVFDSVGGSTYASSVALLKEGGTAVSYGIASSQTMERYLVDFMFCIRWGSIRQCSYCNAQTPLSA